VTDDDLRYFIIALEQRPKWAGTPHEKKGKISRTTLNTYVRGVKEEWLREWMPKLTSDEVPINPYRVINDLANTVVVIGMPNSPELFATVATPSLAEVSRKAAEDTALEKKHIGRPPAGAERYFINDEQAMLTNEVVKIGYRISYCWMLNNILYSCRSMGFLLYNMSECRLKREIPTKDSHHTDFGGYRQDASD